MAWKALETSIHLFLGRLTCYIGNTLPPGAAKAVPSSCKLLLMWDLRMLAIGSVYVIHLRVQLGFDVHGEALATAAGKLIAIHPATCLIRQFQSAGLEDHNPKPQQIFDEV